MNQLTPVFIANPGKIKVLASLAVVDLIANLPTLIGLLIRVILGM